MLTGAFYSLLAACPSLEPAGPRLQIVRAHQSHHRALLSSACPCEGAHCIHNLPKHLHTRSPLHAAAIPESGAAQRLSALSGMYPGAHCPYPSSPYPPAAPPVRGAIVSVQSSASPPPEWAIPAGRHPTVGGTPGTLRYAATQHPALASRRHRARPGGSAAAW